MPLPTPFRRLWPWVNVEMLRSLVDRFGVPLNLSTTDTGYLRTAPIQTLWTLKQADVAPDPILVAYNATGAATATHDPLQSGTVLATAAGEVSLMQSRWYPHYQPGKPFFGEITFTSTHNTGTNEIGIFDDDDGYFLRLSGASETIVHRGYGSDITSVPRASWYDTFDGNGPSGKTIDFSFSQRLWIRYPWLGLGDAEVGFVVDNTPCVAHRFSFENSLVKPHIRRPHLPVRWRASNGASLLALCGEIGSEGGQDLVGSPGVVERDAALAVAAGATQEIGSVRLESGNRNTVFPGLLSVSTLSNAEGIMKLLWNPTFAVDTGWAVENNPGVEVNRARSVTGFGRQLASIPFSSATKEARGLIDPIISLASDYAGKPDEICLAVHNPTAAPINVRGALHFRAVL